MRISRDESLVKQNQVAGVAQLVEQRIRNAKVGSSNPLTGTMIPCFSVKSPADCGAFCFQTTSISISGSDAPANRFLISIANGRSPLPLGRPSLTHMPLNQAAPGILTSYSFTAPHSRIGITSKKTLKVSPAQQSLMHRKIKFHGTDKVSLS